jgi:hypothetical protein
MRLVVENKKPVQNWDGQRKKLCEWSLTNRL